MRGRVTLSATQTEQENCIHIYSRWRASRKPLYRGSPLSPLSLSLFQRSNFFRPVKWSNWSCARMPEAFNLETMWSHPGKTDPYRETRNVCSLFFCFVSFLFLSLSLSLFLFLLISLRRRTKARRGKNNTVECFIGEEGLRETRILGRWNGSGHLARLINTLCVVWLIRCDN